MAQRRTAGASDAAWNAAVDWDVLANKAQGKPFQTSPIAAEEAAAESETFDISGQTGIKGVRQITLAEGISFKSLMTRQVDLERQTYGKLLFWGRIFLGTLYAAASLALLFVVIFLSNGLMPLYEDPLRYSSLDKKWEVALEKTGSVHVDWALLALLFTFSLYHYAHFLGFVSDIYLRLVFYYQMNAIRWVFHGLLGGLMVGFFSIVMGVSSVIVFVLLTLAVMAAAAGMLFSEMINMPTIYTVDTTTDTRESLMKAHGLTACEAGMALKRGWFIKREAVSPWVFLFAVLAAAAYVGIVSYYFWVAVLDTASKVPWYAWTTYFITVLSLIAMVIVNAASLLLNFTFIKNYFYIDVIHNIVEVIFILVNTVLIISGFATAA